MATRNTSDVVLVRSEDIQASIRWIRGQRVMLDADLAELYGVPTKYLNLQVRRNADRFPDDFMFQLTPEEWDNLRLQIATSRRHGGRRTPPYAFTQEGVAMLSSALNSPRAVRMNVEIMRAFVRFRGLLERNDELARKLNELEERLDGRLKKHDTQIAVLFEAIRRLVSKPSGARKPSPRPIGFQSREEESKEPKSRAAKGAKSKARRGRKAG